jgi:hypothetical protein
MSTPREEALERALKYAKTVIENYEMDIRNSGRGDLAFVGVKLDEVGFCQGTIYTGALEIIDRIACGELVV